jgi:cyanophycinase
MMIALREVRMKKSMLLLFVWSCVFPAFAAKQYSYFRVGNPNDVTTATTGGTALEGGGTDVDAVYQWMCQRSGNGDFLVIRATGTDAYNPYIQQLCPNENSVATLIIPNRTAASDPFVATTIQNAEALFIAGGDQSDYINFWKGTPVETALNNLIARNVPIGGTSHLDCIHTTRGPPSVEMHLRPASHSAPKVPPTWFAKSHLAESRTTSRRGS